MALVAIQIPSVTGTAITFATPTTSETIPAGRGVYYIVRAGGTGNTTTVVVPGSTYGQARPDVAITVGVGEEHWIGPLVPDLADSSQLVTITHSSTTSITAAAVQCGI